MRVMPVYLLLLSWPLLSAGTAFAQEEAAARRGVVDTLRSFYISYQNDVFAGTDRYYTQGIRAVLNHPALQRLDAGGTLAPWARGTRYYSLALHVEGYTPSSIRSDSILRGDRPYAGLLYLRASGNSFQPHGRRWQISGAWTLGVIGPPAGGREIQTVIHRAIDDFIPLGWQHQIRTDVLLNYSLTAAYVRVSRGRAGFYPMAGVDVGTFYNGVALSGHGWLNPLGTGRGRKFRLRLRASAEARAVGYDARLQGGMLNRASPYTLSAGEISRLVGRGSVSVDVRLGRVAVGGSYTAITREFRIGLSHAWGGLYADIDF